MSSKRLEELQKKLEDSGEPLTDEELEELEGGEDMSCYPKDHACEPYDGSCTGNPSCSGNP